jgi:hypothetical protein
LLDQRIRSASQLGESIGLPVLGVIEKTTSLSQKRTYKALRYQGDGTPMIPGKA